MKFLPLFQVFFTGFFPFQKRSTNILWRSKRSGFVAQRLWGPYISIHMNLCCCWRTGLCLLGSIKCVLLSMAEDKIIFSRIKWLGDMGDYLLYDPTVKLQYLDLWWRLFPIFFRITRINPVSTFPEDIKCITLI